jgi:hypothetical protein
MACPPLIAWSTMMAPATAGDLGQRLAHLGVEPAARYVGAVPVGLDAHLGRIAFEDRRQQPVIVVGRAHGTHQHDIERRAEMLGDFVGHGNAAARQAEHDRPAVGEGGKLGGQQAAGLGAIDERCRHRHLHLGLAMAILSAMVALR